VTVACETGETGALLAAVYGAFASPEEPSSPAPGLAYKLGPGAAGGFTLRREAEEPLHAANDGLLLFHFEKDLVVELQKRRPDLYFLHAAALERDGRAVLLVAESGAGKSTTTWGLLHHGFRYASDELAPIDLTSGLVLGFPHALCLKADPPASFPLPPGTLRTSRSRHVSVGLLPAALAPTPLPLDAVVFLRYRPDLDRPAIRPMGAAEATARLYVQALNPLAHPGDGLDAAIAIAGRARCFGLETAALDATCALVVSTLFA
jgi:hypothetical protein